jgi:hypothetical protein
MNRDYENFGQGNKYAIQAQRHTKNIVATQTSIPPKTPCTKALSRTPANLSFSHSFIRSASLLRSVNNLALAKKDAAHLSASGIVGLGLGVGGAAIVAVRRVSGRQTKERPIDIWTQFLASDFTICKPLNRWAVFRRYAATVRFPLAHSPFRYANVLSQGLHGADQ